MAALENIAQGKSKCTVLDNQTALREHFSSNIENINTLYKIAIDRQQDEQAREQKEAEMVEDEMEDMM